MKKIIVLCCLMLVLGGISPYAKAINWVDLGEKVMMDTDSFKHKGNYIDFDLKFNDISAMNKMMKEEKSGLMFDASIVSSYISHIKYDCKNARIKYEYNILYSKENEIVRKWRNNTWDYAKYGEIDQDAIQALNQLCEY